VKEARVSYERGEAWVRYDDRKVSVARLCEVIDGTGFRAAGVVRASKPSARIGKRRVT
jgi:copper chaperone CopZ